MSKCWVYICVYVYVHLVIISPDFFLHFLCGSDNHLDGLLTIHLV